MDHCLIQTIPGILLTQWGGWICQSPARIQTTPCQRKPGTSPVSRSVGGKSEASQYHWHTPTGGEVTTFLPGHTNVPPSTSTSVDTWLLTQNPHQNTNLNIDPDDMLSHNEKVKFVIVFGSDLPNSMAQLTIAKDIINMGPTQPPQWRGQLPHYNDNKLKELQPKFDELDVSGIFRQRESLNIAVKFFPCW